MVTKCIYKNLLEVFIIMKSTNTKVNIRVSDEEYNILKGKAKDADVSVSTFLREIALKGRVNYLDNGKEIARQIGTLHGKMEMYHQDIINQIDKVNTTLEESNRLVKDNCGINYSDTKQILEYQKMRFKILSDTLLHSYEEHEKNVDSKLQQVISFIWER